MPYRSRPASSSGPSRTSPGCQTRRRRSVRGSGETPCAIRRSKPRRRPCGLRAEAVQSGQVRLRRCAATARHPRLSQTRLVYRAEPRRRRAKDGGPDRDRTGDLMNAIHARSQLRHRPTRGKNNLQILPHSPAASQPLPSRARTLGQPDNRTTGTKRMLGRRGGGSEAGDRRQLAAPETSTSAIAAATARDRFARGVGREHVPLSCSG